VDFSKGANALEVLVAALYGGQIEVRRDAINGPLLGVVNIINKGEGDIWRSIKTPVKSLTGLHDLYFVFKGKHDLFSYGLKLFLIINAFGEIMNAFFTPGNVADNNLDTMVKFFGKLKGYAFADKGFINAKASESLMNKGLLLITS